MSEKTPIDHLSEIKTTHSRNDLLNEIRSALITSLIALGIFSALHSSLGFGHAWLCSIFIAAAGHLIWLKQNNDTHSKNLLSLSTIISLLALCWIVLILLRPPLDAASLIAAFCYTILRLNSLGQGSILRSTIFCSLSMLSCYLFSSWTGIGLALSIWSYLISHAFLSLLSPLRPRTEQKVEVVSAFQKSTEALRRELKRP